MALRLLIRERSICISINIFLIFLDALDLVEVVRSGQESCCGGAPLGRCLEVVQSGIGLMA
jgi:hypothetical protein